MGKKNAIPKKIAGIKLPKKLRKSKVLRGLLASAAGREILASALTAGAAAAAAALMGAGGRPDGGTKKGGAVGLVSGALHDGAGAIMQVVANAARSVLADKPAGPAPGETPTAPPPEEPRH